MKSSVPCILAALCVVSATSTKSMTPSKLTTWSKSTASTKSTAFTGARASPAFPTKAVIKLNADLEDVVDDVGDLVTDVIYVVEDVASIEKLSSYNNTMVTAISSRDLWQTRTSSLALWQTRTSSLLVNPSRSSSSASATASPISDPFDDDDDDDEDEEDDDVEVTSTVTVIASPTSRLTRTSSRTSFYPSSSRPVSSTRSSSISSTHTFVTLESPGRSSSTATSSTATSTLTIPVVSSTASTTRTVFLGSPSVASSTQTIINIHDPSSSLTSTPTVTAIVSPKVQSTSLIRSTISTVSLVASSSSSSSSRVWSFTLMSPLTSSTRTPQATSSDWREDVDSSRFSYISSMLSSIHQDNTMSPSRPMTSSSSSLVPTLTMSSLPYTSILLIPSSQSQQPATSAISIISPTVVMSMTFQSTVHSISSTPKAVSSASPVTPSLPTLTSTSTKIVLTTLSSTLETSSSESLDESDDDETVTHVEPGTSTRFETVDNTETTTMSMTTVSAPVSGSATSPWTRKTTITMPGGFKSSRTTMVAIPLASKPTRTTTVTIPESAAPASKKTETVPETKVKATGTTSCTTTTGPHMVRDNDRHTKTKEFTGLTTVSGSTFLCYSTTKHEGPTVDCKTVKDGELDVMTKIERKHRPKTIDVYSTLDSTVSLRMMFTCSVVSQHHTSRLSCSPLPMTSDDGNIEGKREAATPMTVKDGQVTSCSTCSTWTSIY